MISIIVPNYNHGKFLIQRIDSILNQTYQKFEIIILDDCSTDNSKEIIESYRNNRKISSIVYNTENSGNTFSQWKKGIELAKGDWVWIAESDDWCEPSLLQELVKGRIDSDCALSFCQSVTYSENDILWTSNAKYLEQLQLGEEFVFTSMLKRNAIFNASMCIFKKSLYYKISQNFLNYQFIGDWVFWIEIALNGKVFISGKTLNYFRSHSKNVSSAAAKAGLLYLEYFKMLEYLGENHPTITAQSKTLLESLHRQLILDETIHPEFKKTIQKRFKNDLGAKYYRNIIWQFRNYLRSF